MCVVSMVMDVWKYKLPERWPQWVPPHGGVGDWNPLSRFEFEEQKKMIEEMREEIKSLKKLVEAAKKYDEETGQPDCEQAEKIALVKKIAEIVGVDVNQLFTVNTAV